jgi:formiminoglutamase
MDISIFFEPLKLQNSGFADGTIGSTINLFNEEGFPILDGASIAIIGVKEDRRSEENKGCANAPDIVRGYLYKLFLPNPGLKVIDLGNINPGHSVEDTYFALSSVAAHLIKNKVIPVIIGGSQDLTYASYLAYEKLEQTVNLVSIDNSIDLGSLNEEVCSKSYLGKIIMHQPNYLFNYSNIGYQTYFVDPKMLELMAKLYFDCYRLGEIRGHLEETEPIIRNADMLSFDITSIRFADAPGSKLTTPNGFYGEEACQIARYAGMSDKLTSIGFYEINPQADTNNITSYLAAQMIWYFIEGFTNRKKDFPVGEKTDYLKYRVAIKDSKYEIVFYKSNKSGRWWMDVPYPEAFKSKYQRHHLVPCSYRDYQVACNDEMPDRWWSTYLKLS